MAILYVVIFFETKPKLYSHTHNSSENAIVGNESKKVMSYLKMNASCWPLLLGGRSTSIYFNPPK